MPKLTDGTAQGVHMIRTSCSHRKYICSAGYLSRAMDAARRLLLKIAIAHLAIHCGKSSGKTRDRSQSYGALTEQDPK